MRFFLVRLIIFSEFDGDLPILNCQFDLIVYKLIGMCTFLTVYHSVVVVDNNTIVDNRSKIWRPFC